MTVPVKLLGQTGASAIIVVVVIGVATLLIAKSASFIGLSQVEQSFMTAQADTVAQAADGCLEEVLRQLQLNPDFSSISEFAIGSSTCQVVINADGDYRDTIIVAHQESFYKKIKTRVLISAAGLRIINWQADNN